jgi:hypothetical protein
MWCPDCHTAFDWNTGRKEVGRIHNPHFYEFQRAGGRIMSREFGDIPCGGLPDVQELYNALGMRRVTFAFASAMNPYHSELLDIHRLVYHIQGFELRNQKYNTDTPFNTLEYRVRYLMNEVSEQEFRALLQRCEKAREKNRDIGNVLRMFCDVTGDSMRQIVLQPTTLREHIETLHELRLYVTQSFKIIQNRYSCVTPHINNNWALVTSKSIPN